MRIGIVGLGSIGKRHATNALALGHEVITVDTHAEAGAHCEHVSFMLDEVTPDALLICTPANTHSQIARELRDLGYDKALFCEKPLALSVEDCAVFRDWPHPVTMVGYNLRFHPTARYFKSVGGWTQGAFYCNCDNGKYGNDLFELSHEIDLALWLGVEPTPWGLCGYEENYWRQWQVWNDRSTSLVAEFFSPEALGTQMYVDELAHFLACAEKNEPTITPFADGIRVVEICETAMKIATA